MPTGKILAQIVNYGLDGTSLSFDVEVLVLDATGIANAGNVPDETLLPTAILVPSTAGRNAIHDSIAKGVVSRLALSPYSVTGFSYKEVIVTGYSGRGANGGSFVTQSCVLVGARTRIVDRSGRGGATVGAADSIVSSDLPDDTIVRFVTYYGDRKHAAITLRFAAIDRTTGLSTYLNGSELTLDDQSGKIARKSASILLSSFSAGDRAAIRNAQGFWVYTKNNTAAQKTDTVVLYYAAVAFDLSE